MYDYSNATITASKPLTLEAYTTFVLIPHIAALLIAEDLHTDVEGGWEAMQLGIERGKKENGLQNSDPTLDSVFTANEERRLKCLNSGQKTKGAGPAKKGKENISPVVCPYTSGSVIDVKLILDRHQAQAKKKAKTESQKPDARTTRGTTKMTMNDYPEVSLHVVHTSINQ
jgi:hypothetical protein